MPQRITVELTPAEADATVEALLELQQQYEQGDMEGIRSPQKTASVAKAIDGAISKLYGAGYRP
jgi:hypothetical protein